MNQKSLKNYLKLILLLLGISVSAIACQKDDGISTENKELPKLKVETLYNPDLTKKQKPLRKAICIHI